MVSHFHKYDRVIYEIRQIGSLLHAKIIIIIDGKLTENYVSPVVMSGSVPELLKSITMISGGEEIIGAGMCGKGYKEWVRVTDGGPALKVKVKLA